MTLDQYDKSLSLFQGDCENIALTDMNDEGEFRVRGCDVRHPGSNLGQTVYAVSGYNPENSDHEDLGYVCGECMQYIYYAEIPEFVEDL